MSIPVTYICTAAMPDDFKGGANAIVEGDYAADGTFRAQAVQAPRRDQQQQGRGHQVEQPEEAPVARLVAPQECGARIPAAIRGQSDPVQRPRSVAADRAPAAIRSIAIAGRLIERRLAALNGGAGDIRPAYGCGRE